MGDLLINLLASVIAGTTVWLTGFLLRRRKLSRERAFFGLTAGASCLLVVSRHASSPREFSVHRRDVAALVELATIARECGAHADRVGENQPTGEIGRLTEFCVGGPGGASPCSATHVRTILRGVTYEVFDEERRRMSFTVGGIEYVLNPEASYVMLARFWGPTGGHPVFFIGGLSAGSNLAGARYLAAHHLDLNRTYGSDRPFALVLRIVEPAAYGTEEALEQLVRRRGRQFIGCIHHHRAHERREPDRVVGFREVFTGWITRPRFAAGVAVPSGPARYVCPLWLCHQRPPCRLRVA